MWVVTQPQLIPTKYFNCVEFIYWFACVPLMLCLHLLYHTLELDKSVGVKYHGNTIRGRNYYESMSSRYLVLHQTDLGCWLTTLQFLIGPPDLIKQFKYVRPICHCIVMSIQCCIFDENINVKYNTQMWHFINGQFQLSPKFLELYNDMTDTTLSYDCA